MCGVDIIVCYLSNYLVKFFYENQTVQFYICVVWFIVAYHVLSKGIPLSLYKLSVLAIFEFIQIATPLHRSMLH